MKNARREAAIKKEKRKKLIFLVVCVVVAVAIATLVIIGLYQQHNTRVFSDGGQVVTLRPNGTFTAELAHETKRGTYAENTEGGGTIISFVYDGETQNGSILDRVMIIPDEWEDSHGHGTRLRLQ